MPLDYSDPNVIRYLKETYDKENENCIAWFVKNKEKIIKAATLTEKHKGYRTEDTARALIEPLMPVLSEHYKVTMVNRITKQTNKPIPLVTKTENYHNDSEDDLGSMPESKIKPVDPNITRILYEDVPLGRQNYLNARCKKSPDKRYYFCETSNGVYGWRIGNGNLFHDSGEYRRYTSLMRETVNRSGAQPDPKHYGQLQQQHSKCRA